MDQHAGAAGASSRTISIPDVQFLEDVISGLSAGPKTIPPKYFYDAEGSRLFDAICETPEYYITRTECRLLGQVAAEVASWTGTRRVIVEPGSGNSRKVQHLLGPMQPRAYVPVEICAEHLAAATGELRERFPQLAMHPVCGDFTRLEALPLAAEDGPVGFFPGSTIGNFEPEQAAGLLRAIGRLLGAGGLLLIGIDRLKPARWLNAAYNDAAGLTAAFNRNLLRRINRELGADFRPEQFRHLAFYNETEGRVEMHLESRCEQVVNLAGEHFRFERGETIHTENSYKYDEERLDRLARHAGYRRLRSWSDRSDLFGLHLMVVESWDGVH